MLSIDLDLFYLQIHILHAPLKLIKHYIKSWSFIGLTHWRTWYFDVSDVWVLYGLYHPVMDCLKHGQTSNDTNT